MMRINKERRAIFIVIIASSALFILSVLLQEIYEIMEYLALAAFLTTGIFIFLLINSFNSERKKEFSNAFDPEYYLFFGRRTQNAVLDLVIYVMSLDGTISNYEDKRFEAFLRANYPNGIAKNILQVYLARKKAVKKATHKSIQWLKEDLDYRMKLRLIDLLIRTATYDKLLSNKEHEFILDTARRLGIPARTVLIILDRHDFIEEKDIGDKHQNKKEVLSSESFLLKQLDLDDNVDNLAIKKRYRELVKIYHPDKLLEASEQEKLEAEMKFLDIQEAYDKLQALRKM